MFVLQLSSNWYKRDRGFPNTIILQHEHEKKHTLRTSSVVFTRHTHTHSAPGHQWSPGWWQCGWRVCVIQTASGHCPQGEWREMDRHWGVMGREVCDATLPHPSCCLPVDITTLRQSLNTRSMNHRTEPGTLTAWFFPSASHQQGDSQSWSGWGHGTISRLVCTLGMVDCILANKQTNMRQLSCSLAERGSCDPNDFWPWVAGTWGTWGEGGVGWWQGLVHKTNDCVDEYPEESHFYSVL